MSEGSSGEESLQLRGIWVGGEMLSVEAVQTLHPFLLLTSFLMNDQAARSSCSVESTDCCAGSQRALLPDVMPAWGLEKPALLLVLELPAGGWGGYWRVVPGQMGKRHPSH